MASNVQLLLGPISAELALDAKLTVAVQLLLCGEMGRSVISLRLFSVRGFVKKSVETLKKSVETLTCVRPLQPHRP